MLLNKLINYWGSPLLLLLVVRLLIFTWQTFIIMLLMLVWFEVNFAGLFFLFNILFIIYGVLWHVLCLCKNIRQFFSLLYVVVCCEFAKLKIWLFQCNMKLCSHHQCVYLIIPLFTMSFNNSSMIYSTYFQSFVISCTTGDSHLSSPKSQPPTHQQKKRNSANLQLLKI